VVKLRIQFLKQPTGLSLIDLSSDLTQYAALRFGEVSHTRA
jgi:hypothetical protein